MSTLRAMSPTETLLPGKLFLVVVAAQSGPPQRPLDAVRELAAVRSHDGPDPYQHPLGVPAMAEVFMVTLPIGGATIAGTALGAGTRAGLVGGGAQFVVIDAFNAAAENIETWIADHKTAIDNALHELGQPFRDARDTAGDVFGGWLGFVRSFATIAPFLPWIAIGLVGVLAYAVASGKVRRLR